MVLPDVGYDADVRLDDLLLKPRLVARIDGHALHDHRLGIHVLPGLDNGHLFPNVGRSVARQGVIPAVGID